MFWKNANELQNRIDSLIGVGTRIEGNVTFAGGLRVDGEIMGNILASGDQPNTLVLSERAHVDGEVHVSHLVVNGAINGPVHSTEFVELHEHCRVTGDVHYKSLEMHLGAVVDGRLVPNSSVTDTSNAVELKTASRT